MSKRLRVLFLTQYFPPETGAPQARLFEMARHLVQRGFEVEVLTALPNYPQGRIYEGYRGKLFMVECQEGMRVVRAPIFPSRSASLLPRMANYLSFVVSSLLAGLLLARRPDVIICESPPLFLGLSARALKVVQRCRLIFNVSDLWPETAVRMGQHDRRLFIWLARRLEWLCYRGSDAATAQSPGIVQGIRQRRPRGVVELIPNGCDCQLFHPDRRCHEFRRRYNLTDHVVVGYAGLLGLAQGLGAVIEVAERFRADDRVRFLIAGDGAEREKIERQVAERGLSNVIFTGWLARSEMPGTIASFDMALIPLRYFIPGALPSKVYEAMASGVPIVLAAEGDARQVIQRSGAGRVVDYHDTGAIAAAVDELAGDAGQRRRLGQRGRQYVLQHHQRHDIAARLGDLIEAVTGRGNAADGGRATSLRRAA